LEETTMPLLLASPVIRPNGLHEARNDFGKAGYAGPCPPKGTGPTITTSAYLRSVGRLST
jgi:phosphatidylethanolamine-binding protein (PEBP) family uncharacterized protein